MFPSNKILVLFTLFSNAIATGAHKHYDKALLRLPQLSPKLEHN